MLPRVLSSTPGGIVIEGHNDPPSGPPRAQEGPPPESQSTGPAVAGRSAEGGHAAPPASTWGLALQCPLCGKPATWKGNPYRPFCTERCKSQELNSGPAVWIATCAGAGYFPFAPGTAGSAVGLLVVVLLGLIHFAPPWPSVILMVLAGSMFGLGVWAAGIAEKFFKRVDPGPVVIDEVVGQFITFLWRPHAPWKLLIAGFVLFRVFDILKPFPAGRAEHAPGGWGIMLDDVVAGVYALGGVILLGLVFP